MKLALLHFLLILPVLSPHIAHADETLPPLVIQDQLSGQQPSEFQLFPGDSATKTPQSQNEISEKALEKNHITRPAEITKVEASTTENYNPVGYWDSLAIRGFTLDSRYNYFREGLPITSESTLPLDNKSEIQVLKGLSGLQVGSSSPGGAINYVVQRPGPFSFNELKTSTNQFGNFYLSGNHSNRFHGVFELLKPGVRHSDGQRYMIALAENWQWGESILIQAEIEHFNRRQKSQGTYSLFGTKLPDNIDPRLNLNYPSWAQPMDFTGTTATVKISQVVTSSFQWELSAGGQKLVTQDRLAYASGCSAENVYDRYCSDGSFDVYDYRSENERKNSWATKVSLQYQQNFGGFLSHWNLGALKSSLSERYQKQAYNYVGSGKVGEEVPLPGNATANDENTNRDAEILEVFLRQQLQKDAIKFWWGLRHTDIYRHSVRTNGSRETQFQKPYLIPWAALSYEFLENYFTYVSYSEGLETYITPNKNSYARPGAFIDPAISRQWEIGLKDATDTPWALAFFRIERPLLRDAAPLYALDGDAIHEGVEFSAEKRINTWHMLSSLMFLNTRQENSSSSQINQTKPVNIPGATFRLTVEKNMTSNLNLWGRMSYESQRYVTLANDITLPAWEVFDLGAQYRFKNSGGNTEISLLAENIFDKKFFRESPLQYGHIYLYAGRERTWTLSLLHRF